MNKELELRPVFIFSLPRSGSTLLQRILTVHEGISSTTEPWVLLPFFYPLRDRGVYAEYSHLGVYRAVQDFCDELPNGEKDYLESINCAAMSLYKKVSAPGSVFFVDKTPRYSLICKEIVSAFPDAKIIFLWRNPLSIISSVIDTWGAGRWNVFKYKVDLYQGMSNLIDCCSSGENNYLTVNYEELIGNPYEVVEGVFDYLEGVDYCSSCVDEFSSVAFNGAFGDPTGVKKYKSVNSSVSGAIQLNTPLRKWWCKKYLNWLGCERLKCMGYDFNELLDELESVPVKWGNLPMDIIMMLYGLLSCSVDFVGLRRKIQKLPDWKLVNIFT